ncbi:MAG TPA: amidohydrolase [Bacteroidia bacterium]|jgi:predicted amidohydrolase YtcJ|nr:amidohydrolase [Bacteroidia bacterium]
MKDNYSGVPPLPQKKFGKRSLIIQASAGPGFTLQVLLHPAKYRAGFSPGFPLQSLTRRYIKLVLSFSMLFLFSCSQKQQWVDLIVFNANIYTVDSAFSVQQSMAISGGKIVATGTDEEIKTKYNSSTLMNADGKTIFPGFIDAHCHFLGYGLGLQQIDLVGTKSFDEVIERVKEFVKAHPADTGKGKWIIGRGWDQNDWAVKEYPTNTELDILFPNTPVLLKRIDGHAALANHKALELAQITGTTKVEGGSLLNMPWPCHLLRDNMYILGKCTILTGILIDNAVDLVTKVIPQPTKEQMQKALLAAQKNCFAVGLTTVDDAGLMKDDIDIIDELQKKGDLKMRIYAMLSDSAPNYKHYFKTGPYKTDKLNVHSFKFYADGALGSRGACLLKDYEDKKGWKGFLLSHPQHFPEKAAVLIGKGFQMNTHCIGDSAVRLVEKVYLFETITNFEKDGTQSVTTTYNVSANTARWRIEHFQITSKEDLLKLKGSGIIPSIQPTHATSDMYWAEQRLGKERIKYAYAYKDLLKAAGIVALGTDFPVEDISPFKTFYAAVFRKDTKGFPAGGFQPENALTREETIKGMTIWAAYSNFEEKEKGSLEPGKFADFILLDTDLMKCAEGDILKSKVLYTFVNGQMVFEGK